MWKEAAKEAGGMQEHRNGKGQKRKTNLSEFPTLSKSSHVSILSVVRKISGPPKRFSLPDNKKKERERNQCLTKLTFPIQITACQERDVNPEPAGGRGGGWGSL